MEQHLCAPKQRPSLYDTFRYVMDPELPFFTRRASDAAEKIYTCGGCGEIDCPMQLQS